MMHIPQKPAHISLVKRFQKWLAREDGSASIEFIAIMPLAVAILFASVEAGIITLRKTYLDRALEMTVRELRLGIIPNPSTAELRTRICNRMAMVENCASNLTLELHVRSASTASPMTVPSLTDLCINRTTSVEPVLNFQPGVANDLVLVRACLLQEIVFPTSESQLSVANTENSKYQLISTTAFVNEPG
jgi:Flp pilus assembly protein TadG